jgi:hypothetical protein
VAVLVLLLSLNSAAPALLLLPVTVAVLLLLLVPPLLSPARATLLSPVTVAVLLPRSTVRTWRTAIRSYSATRQSVPETSIHLSVELQQVRPRKPRPMPARGMSCRRASGAVCSVHREKEGLMRQANPLLLFRDDASRHGSLFLHVIFGSVATSALVIVGIQPILASSGVTISYLLAAFLLRFKGQQPAAVFCGTFAGMTSFFVFFNRHPSSLGFPILIYLCIAIATGFLYVLIMRFEHALPKRLFSGYGGRLGAIAFIGSAVCLMITGLLIWVVSGDFQVVALKDTAPFSGEAPIAMILISAIGSLLTRILAGGINSAVPVLDVVLSSSVCGFVGGMIFLAVPSLGPIAGLYWYAGSFAGMSSTSILDSHARILVAGTMTGVFLAGLNLYGSGVGGLLGFSAFLAVIVTKSTADFVYRRSVSGL